MKRSVGWYLSCVIVASLSLIAAAPPNEQSFVLTNVTVVNVEARDGRNALQDHQDVAVDRGRIVAMRPSGSKARDRRRIDAAGKFLIPGLWDMHVHTGHREVFFPLYLANGITGVRDMGGDQERPTGILSIRFDLLKQWRSAVERGRVLGPHLVIAGFMVDGPQPVWPGALAVKNEGDAVKIVHALKQQEVDFIKVYSGVPRDAYFALARQARIDGVSFVGHLPDAISPREASEARQHSIEHLAQGRLLVAVSSREEELLQRLAAADAERDPLRTIDAYLRVYADAADSYSEAKAAALLSQFVRNGTWQVPTLVLRAATFGLRSPTRPEIKYVPPTIRETWNTSRPLSALPLEAQEAGRKAFVAQMALVAAMQRAGVGILAGSDAANPDIYPGFSLHEELRLLVRAGLTPLEALRTATINPARFLKRDAVTGSITTGKVADLVLLDANPLEDIRNTERVDGIVLRGRYLAHSALGLLLKSAEAAANTDRDTPARARE